jgi:hypothetical protein
MMSVLQCALAQAETKLLNLATFVRCGRWSMIVMLCLETGPLGSLSAELLEEWLRARLRAG